MTWHERAQQWRKCVVRAVVFYKGVVLIKPKNPNTTRNVYKIFMMSKGSRQRLAVKLCAFHKIICCRWWTVFFSLTYTEIRKVHIFTKINGFVVVWDPLLMKCIIPQENRFWIEITTPYMYSIYEFCAHVRDLICFRKNFISYIFNCNLSFAFQRLFSVYILAI